jgi:hypothetical protein
MQHLATALIAVLPLALSGQSQIDKLIPALVQVESNGNVRAVGDGGRSLGYLQISKEVVIDVNRLTGSSYRHSDAFNPAKANAICKAYLAHYASAGRLGREPTFADLARIWNGGPEGHRKASTIRYWRKVSSQLG